jgi:hypothetical protein
MVEVRAAMRNTTSAPTICLMRRLKGLASQDDGVVACRKGAKAAPIIGKFVLCPKLRLQPMLISRVREPNFPLQV